jgi:hypothetical protein
MPLGRASRLIIFEIGEATNARELTAQHMKLANKRRQSWYLLGQAIKNG